MLTTNYGKDDLESYLKDGRLTEPSGENRFEWRKMIKEVKRLGRPLSKEEVEKCRVPEYGEEQNILDAAEDAHLLEIAMSRENSSGKRRNRIKRREPIHRSVNVLSSLWLIFSLSANHRLIRSVYISDFFVVRQPSAHPSDLHFGLNHSPSIAI